MSDSRRQKTEIAALRDAAREGRELAAEAEKKQGRYVTVFVWSIGSALGVPLLLTQMSDMVSAASIAMVQSVFVVAGIAVAIFSSFGILHHGSTVKGHYFGVLLAETRIHEIEHGSRERVSGPTGRMEEWK